MEILHPVTAADGVITAIAPTTGATWHEYTPRPETSSLNQSLVSDRPNGLVLWDVSLTLVWGIWDVTKMVEARALALSDTVWMVEDNNGNWWYIGYDRPAYMSEADITTGTALDDPINYTLTILNRSNEPVYRVDEKVIEAVLGK